MEFKRGEEISPEALHEMWETLDAQYENAKRLMKERDQLATFIAQRFGIGHNWQDKDGVVYQVGPWTGTFVGPKEFQVDRTRREGEIKGTLSMTHARDVLGYTVEGKGPKPQPPVITEAPALTDDMAGFTREFNGATDEK